MLVVRPGPDSSTAPCLERSRHSNQHVYDSVSGGLEGYDELRINTAMFVVYSIPVEFDKQLTLCPSRRLHLESTKSS